MAVELGFSESLVEVIVTGRLTAQDYQQLTPLMESRLKDGGKLSVLVELRDFTGWTWPAIWEEIKFDARHAGHIDRVAVVGRKLHHEAMAAFPHPFPAAEIAYFDEGQSAEARRWLRGEDGTPPMLASATNTSETEQVESAPPGQPTVARQPS